MDLIDDYAVLRGVDEVVEVRGPCAAVLLGEVGFCRLDGRGKLDFVDVSRLDFRLHEVVHLAVKSAADDSKIPYFILQNDWLICAVGAPETRYLEKAARRGADGAGELRIVPWGAA